MKQSYYYLASSLVELAWGRPAEWTTVSDLVEFCLEQLHPDDHATFKYLFLFSDIKNAINHKKPGDPYLLPAYYSEDEFDDLLVAPDMMFSFLGEFFDNKAASKRQFPALIEIDELTTMFYMHLDELQNEFLQDYFERELELRNISAAIAHRHNKLPFEHKLIPWGSAYNRLRTSSAADFDLSSDFPYVDSLLEAYANIDLAAQEELLAEIRWQQLDDMTAGDFFSIEYILAYVQKLREVERWNSLDPERGQELFDELLRTVRRSVRFELEFSHVGEDKR